MSLFSRMAYVSSFSKSLPVRESAGSSPVMTILELEQLLYTGKCIHNHADEVWPNLYLGDQGIASSRSELSRLGITHILNCAHSNWRSGADYYKGMCITYLGIEARDSPTFDMSVNFTPAADFIHQALSGGGRILVHCAVGVSRSATLVLAYLMIREHMTLVDAIKTVKDRRGIIPNRGFLRQLTVLDTNLRYGRRI
ncbi:dual specificity protein phosphatase 26-like [Paramormyrops kingsleyae]|uniref:dual specificity protein phosphatase 26-like n=1 Tax=Paramormyrops kingsleyae TaxID=1676925 RepID=UPI003B9717F2